MTPPADATPPPATSTQVDSAAAVPPADGVPTPVSKGALGIVFLTVFIDLLGFGIVLPLLPLYGKHFTTDDTGAVTGLLMASFSAMQFLFAPWWGRLSDRIGRRPVLLVGLAGSVVFYLLFAVATVLESLTLLFVARIGAGIAGATIPTAQAFIADVTPPEKRAGGMALLGAAFGLGFTFGPVLAWLSLPNHDLKPGPGPGYAAAALSAVALIWGWRKLPETLRPHAGGGHHRWSWSLLGELRLVPSVGVLILAFCLCILAFAAFESTVSLLLAAPTEHRNLDFGRICLTFTFVGFLSLIGQGVIVRRLSKFVPETPLALAGAVIEGLGFVLLARAGTSGSHTEILVALAIVVLGFSCLNPTLNALISRRTDPARQGAVLGLAQGLGSLARIVGPVAGIIAFDSLHRTGVWPGAPYWLAAGVIGTAALLILWGARGGRDFQATPPPAA